VVLRLLIGVSIVLSGAMISGQQPNRKPAKPEPYVAALLPVEEVWSTTLAAPPAAGGALDDHQVYVPLDHVSTTVDGESVRLPDTASIAALDRATGVVRWYNPIESVWPPVVGGGLVFAAAAGEVHAVHAMTGIRQWMVRLDGELRAPMLLRGNLLVALTTPGVLIAIRIDTQQIAWRHALGDTGAVSMDADQRAIYLTTERGRVMRVNLADGLRPWERTLDDKARLSAPAIGPQTVFVGASTHAFWAINADNGKERWRWPAYRLFGGPIAGAAVAGDTVYVTAHDNLLRALDRDNGNQRWKASVGTRPLGAPAAFFGIVVVTGLAPTLTTFNGKTEALVSTWSAPPGAQLQGAPLIDQNLKPFQVAIVAIMRDGRITGLRPTAMTFPEPVAAPLTTLPGRALPRERLPGDPDPAAAEPLAPEAQ
jgi:outer membrane protein assembly factor BamB